MKMSPQGLAALAQFEGVVLTTYMDSVGVPTIGVGHTAAAGPPVPVKGMTVTRQEAMQILARDLPQYERAVEKRMPHVPQWVFDGAVSFAFNLGPGNFAKASWVAKYAAGDKAGAEASYKQWNKAKGRVIPGLTTRRRLEADMIFRNRYPDGQQYRTAMPDYDQPVIEPPKLVLPPRPPPDIPGPDPTEQPARSSAWFWNAFSNLIAATIAAFSKGQ